MDKLRVHGHSRKNVPAATIIDEAITLQEIFSLRKRLDIKDAQMGEDELSGAALETPMSLMPKRNTTPPNVIPKSPDINK